MDEVLSIMTLFGLIFIFGGLFLSIIFKPAGYFILIGFLFMFIQSVITLFTWKQNRLSENIAAIGFVASTPAAIIIGLIGFITK